MKIQIPSFISRRSIGQMSVAVLTLFALTHCGNKNNDTNNNLPATSVATCDPNGQSCLYEFRTFNNGQLACEIPRQQFNNREEFCQRLIDDAYNKFCVPELRRQSYNNLCINGMNNGNVIPGSFNPGVNSPFNNFNNQFNNQGNNQNNLIQNQPVNAGLEASLPSYVCSSQRVDTSKFFFGLLTITKAAPQFSLNGTSQVRFTLGGGVYLYASLEIGAEHRVRVEVVDCNQNRFSVAVPAGQRIVISANAPQGQAAETIVCTPTSYFKPTIDQRKSNLVCRGTALVGNQSVNIINRALPLNNGAPTGLIYTSEPQTTASESQAQSLLSVFDDVKYQSNVGNVASSISAKVNAQYSTAEVTVMTGYGSNIRFAAKREGGQISEYQCQAN